MLFDLVVLGKDAPGLAVAIRAAELDQRVAVVDDPNHFGVSAPLGENWKKISAIHYFSGFTKFATAESLEIQDSQKTHQIQARRFVLACGNRPKRPPHVPFDGQRILDSDETKDLEPMAQPWLIVGAGEHGLDCARQLIARGVRVSIVDQCNPLPESQFSPATRQAWEAIRQSQCSLHWGTTVMGAERRNSLVMVFHENGSIESFAGVVFAVGRVGCTEHLNLPHPELLLDETQRVWCNDFGQTGVPHIYAVGSVVGFPRVADSPARQAARVIEHALQEARPSPKFPKLQTGDLLLPQG